MQTFFLVIELISALVVVVTVLLHSAKGEGLAGFGGQAKLFNSQKGLEAGLTKVTVIATAIFMSACLINAFLF